MKDKKPNSRPELFIDNDRYDWETDDITGAQIRELAGAPEDFQIFHKVPGSPDELVNNCDVIDLSIIKGPDRFYTQPVGSQAG